MRIPMLAALLGLSLVGCAGQIDGGGGGGGGGGDDITPGPDCGDNTINTGESCDDGNTVSGDGCSATCQVEAAPRLDVALDKPTLATELGKAELVTLTLTSFDGFSGDVNIAASLVDSTMAPIAPAVLGLAGPSTVTLTAGQSSPAAYTITVPSNSTGSALTATLKLDVTSSAGSQNLTSAISVTPRYTITYAAGTGTVGTNHPVLSGTQTANVTLKRGAIIRYINADTIQHDTHGGGIFDHQGTNGGQPGTSYEQPTLAAAPGSTGVLGCHENGHGGSAGYVTFTVQ